MSQNDFNRSIESGEYFKEARIWYTQKFLFPVVERSMLIAVSIGCVVTAIVSLYIVATTLPYMTQKLPVAIKMQDSSSVNQVFVAPLQKREDKEDPNKAVARYIVSKFVEMYERYDAFNPKRTIDANWKYISRFSNDNILIQYKNYVAEDANSLTNLLTRYVSRYAKVNLQTMRDDVTLTPVEHFGNEGNYKYFKATIPFYITEVLVRTNPGFNTDDLRKNFRFRAEIEFKMKDINYSYMRDSFFGRRFCKFDDLDLVITDYKTFEDPVAETVEVLPESTKSEDNGITGSGDVNSVIDNSTKNDSQEGDGQTIEIKPEQNTDPSNDNNSQSQKSTNDSSGGQE
jgi:type IV secretory pathway component VirB8